MSKLEITTVQDEPPDEVSQNEEKPPSQGIYSSTTAYRNASPAITHLSVNNLGSKKTKTTRKIQNILPFFPLSEDKSHQGWTSWQWQIRHRIKTVRQLENFFAGAAIQSDIENAIHRFPMAITPYYASLIRKMEPSDPVYRMAVPMTDELHDPPFLLDDPLEEEHDMPVPGLVHRYPDRALIMVTSMCAMYCRHCTRKRVAGQREVNISQPQLKRIINYLVNHPEIHDVILSGGDPLTLRTESLEKIIAAVRSVPSVDIIRIGTRTPVTMPMRITEELVTMLKNYQPLWVNTHFNHPNEITAESRAACARLVDAGIPMGNQTVLLRGVNDNPQVMEELLRGLITMRVRPYYLYQCDLVRGVEHFRTPLSRGIEIMEYLRGRISGFAIPTFVVDAPGGGGKIPVLPNYLITSSPTHTVLRNFEGMLVSYPEPIATGRMEVQSFQTKNKTIESINPTVFDLATGRALKIEPMTSLRKKRRSRRSSA
ncbi:MAG: KamA family radical SAM protein [Proteobacteria bacterium]|nr:KamA family radical SAM protein [Pseudomonadota bacterium]MBU1708399.1 KamA family radical SAM protein [Pseudomonadota bacterium]